VFSLPPEFSDVGSIVSIPRGLRIRIQRKCGKRVLKFLKRMEFGDFPPKNREYATNLLSSLL
jgi:hypothetical protein